MIKPHLRIIIPPKPPLKLPESTGELSSSDPPDAAKLIGPYEAFFGGSSDVWQQYIESAWKLVNSQVDTSENRHFYTSPTSLFNQSSCSNT